MSTTWAIHLAQNTGNDELPNVGPDDVLFESLLRLGTPTKVVVILVLILALYSWLRVLVSLVSGLAFTLSAGTLGIKKTPLAIRRLSRALAAGVALTASGAMTSQVLTRFYARVGVMEYSSFEVFFAELTALRERTEITEYVITACIVASGLILFDVHRGTAWSVPLLYVGAVLAFPAVLLAIGVGLFAFGMSLLGGLFADDEGRLATWGAIGVAVACASYAWSIWAAFNVVDPLQEARQPVRPR